MNPTISVICPVQNMEGKLQNLETWVRQCDSTFQIVLICDSSIDKTLKELQEIKSANPLLKIEIVEGKFGSPGSARNAGLARADSDWVVFWDSDDVGSPQLLSEQVNKNNSKSLDAIVFGYEIYSGSRKLKPWTLWPSTTRKCMDSTSLNPGIWRFCFKRSSIRNISFLHLKMAEDQLFINDFMRKSPRVSFNNSVTYSYFVNVENQLTSNVLALGDLSGAVEALLGQIKADKNIQVFTIRIFGKILITQIKKCKLPLKTRAAIKLIRLILQYPRESAQLIFDTIWEKSN